MIPFLFGLFIVVTAYLAYREVAPLRWRRHPAAVLVAKNERVRAEFIRCPNCGELCPETDPCCPGGKCA